MTDILQAVTTVIVVITAISRIPGAVRSRDARPLCAALVALAAVMLLWFVDRFGILRVDEATGVHNLTTLLRHLLGVLATQATLSYLVMITEVGATERGRRLRWVLSAVVATGMTTTFLLVDRPAQVDDFFTAYAGDGMATAYWVIFMAYLVIAVGWAFGTSLSYRREADKSPLRTGLAWVGAGCFVGILYAIHKIIYVLVRESGTEMMSASASTATTSALFGMGLLLIAVGTTIPLAAERLRVFRKVRDTRELERLWSMLVALKPSIDLQAPTDVGDRLYRRYIEIEDGLLELRDYSDERSFRRALDHAKASGLSGTKAEAFAEAVRIRVAGSRHRLGQRVPAEDRYRPATIDDYKLEVARLVRVARAIQTPSVGSFAASLIAAPSRLHPGTDTMTSLTTTPPQSVRVRSARVVTEVFAPAVLVVGVLLAVGWHSTGSLTGVGWGLLAALFCGIIPISFIVYGVRRGYWTDKHVKVRQQRAVPITVTAISVAVGLSTLAWLDAPAEVIALVLAMLAGLAATMAITLAWKVSIHTAVAGGTAVILTLTYGPILAITAPAVALVGWSRVVLKDHTTAQTIVGAIVGGAVAATIFTLAG